MFSQPSCRGPRRARASRAACEVRWLLAAVLVATGAQVVYLPGRVVNRRPGEIRRLVEAAMSQRDTVLQRANNGERSPLAPPQPAMRTARTEDNTARTSLREHGHSRYEVATM